MRIIFMGTPEFAVASLDALLKEGFDIVGVITAPDRPAGRGQTLKESAVKQYSVQRGLKVLQPVRLKDEQFLQELRTLNADLQVVVAFRMLPEVVWNMPQMGTINLHGSLLPDYRGAAPINWAIINGETQTGVTTFFLKHEIDTGDIIFSEPVNIAADENAGDIHDRLMEEGARLLVRTVIAIKRGDYQETPQDLGDNRQLHHAPKLFKEHCQINWESTTRQVYDLIRGLSPYPTAFTQINSKILKIFKADADYSVTSMAPGEYQTDGKTFLRFGCLDGAISLSDVQLEGKKRMKIDEFLRGVRI